MSSRDWPTQLPIEITPSLIPPALSSVMSWARRNGQVPKSALICLSYSAILGGTMTMIGTSTNLVILGFYTAEFSEFEREAAHVARSVS